MDTNQINFFANENDFTKKLYRGCFPVDSLPKEKLQHLPMLLCVNLCEKSIIDPECHWIGLCIDDVNEIQYFDSAGVASYKSNKHLKNFIALQEKRVVFNNTQIQSETSDKCGVFVLCFLYSRAVKIKYVEFLKTFDLIDLNMNDEIVSKMFKCVFLKKKCF